MKKQTQQTPGEGQHRRSNILIIVLVVFLALIAIPAGIGAFYVNSKLNQINYDEGTVDSTVTKPTDEFGNILDGQPDDGQTDSTTEYVELDESELDAIASQAADALDDDDVMSDKNVISILLIGSDTRSAGGGGRSDAMILATLNRNKQQITLSSLMRDMYVAVPGHGNTRLGHANAYGGPALLLDTVEQNFKVEVDQYALVDFYSLANIIDSLGGVRIYVEPGEVPYINGSVRETNAAGGRNAALLQNSGDVTLTGAQAVGYSRIRYYGNADFGRTQRQRTVLSALLKRFLGASAGQLNNALDAVLPNVTTNISKSELLSYVPLLASAGGYSIEQIQIPLNGTYSGANISGMDVLVPDIAANRAELKEKLY